LQRNNKYAFLKTCLPAGKFVRLSYGASNEVNFIDALLLLNNCLKLQALLSIVALDQVRCS